MQTWLFYRNIHLTDRTMSLAPLRPGLKGGSPRRRAQALCFILPKRLGSLAAHYPGDPLQLITDASG
jgi:hypothetical protein